MKLLLDEHYTQQLAEQLRDQGHDVVSVTERTDLQGLLDEALFPLLPAEQRAILTENWGDYSRPITPATPLKPRHDRTLGSCPRRLLASSSRSWRNPEQLPLAARQTALPRHWSPLRVPSARVKVLIISFYFPPAGGGGVQRPLKLATHLPELGVEVHVLAPDDPKWIHTDEGLALPPHATVHRARYLGPRGRKAGEELRAVRGLQRVLLRARLLPRRFLVPDENVPWLLTAIPAAIRIVRREGIDVVLTTSPPNSLHLIGAAVQRATGVKWVADLRDSLILHPHRRAESVVVRLKERTDHWVARLVARRADAIVAVSEQIADEARAAGARGEVVHIPNGSDFDDFDGMTYAPGDRFRVTHAGSFFGKRDPKPFLTALKALDDPAVVARFVGDFRSADRKWAEAQGFGDRLELIPYVPRRRSLELQRESEALLLLIPDAGGRGKGVLSGKVFEYLAAERPVLAAVPPDGAAAALVRDAGAGVVAGPDDPEALREALAGLVARWRAGTLEAVQLSEEWKERLSRRTNVRDLAALFARVTAKRGPA